jgi:hypothetical protein
MKKFYAGIGSRETPLDICYLMQHITNQLKQEDYWLRSGGAKRADEYCAKGAEEKAQIFIPGDWFKLAYIHPDCEIYSGICAEAYKIAKAFHPNFDGIPTLFQKQLIARNSYQVLGEDLKSPVDFILCWTENGKLVGGTAQALRIAQSYGIKILNLGKEQTKIELEEKFNYGKK